MISKKFGTCSRDAISWLPDEVLGKILSFLPTEQAASTSVLSKRWRNVYRLVDNLHFDDSVWGEDKLESYVTKSDRKFLRITGYVLEECIVARSVFPENFKKFVDRTLTLQCNYPIKKFSLKCHVGPEFKINCRKTCVYRWISNVVERGVLELNLWIKPGVQFMPPQLFTSKTLVKLTLGTQLSIEKLLPYVSLPSLKTLFIDTIFFLPNDLFSVLLSGCPVLEELSVRHKEYSETPQIISSPTVKRLSVDYDYDKSFDRQYLSLNLPNLVYLEYSDFALANYPLVNLESLVEAKLDLYLEKGYRWIPNVTNLVLGLRNVEILHLSPASVDVISRCANSWLILPVFNNLVKLYFGSNNLNKRGWKFLAYLLKQSPNLETLIIQNLDGYRGDDVPMPQNKVKMLHILGYRETVESLKQLKSFVGEFKCLEMVKVDVVGEDNSRILQTKMFLLVLFGFSLPSKCHFKVT